MTDIITGDNYTQFRADGWPLCPRCEEDELWAHGPDMDIHNPPTLQQMVDAIRGCLYCGWKPPLRAVSGHTNDWSESPLFAGVNKC